MKKTEVSLNWEELVETQKTGRRPTHLDIEEAIRTLAERGEIYDTGERKMVRPKKSYQIVWAAVPPKNQQS